MKRVWVISGSDNTAGAGLQKDLLTIQDLGSQAATVVSCVTSQNQNGIQHIEPVSETSFITQLDSLMALETPDVVKVGMLGNIRQVDLLLGIFNTLRQQNSNLKIVLDPVCMASSGGESSGLTPDDLLPLMAVCDLVTPNISEANQLLKTTIKNLDDAKDAAKELHSILNQNHSVNTELLLKGGHLETGITVVDTYATQQQLVHLKSDSIKTEYNHGTGCTFASAVAATLAQKYEIEDAVVIAKAYMMQSLYFSHALSNECSKTNSYGTTGHKGWPVNPKWMPSIETSNHHRNAFLPVNQLDFRFYPVVDSLVWIERLLKAGVKTLQLRIKKPVNDAWLEQEIKNAIALGKHYNAQLFINDYWEFAIKHDAYGVHLGQEDLLDANISKIREAGLRLGISTHGYMELLKAVEIQPSYIALGHIFPTQTKDMPSIPQGTERLAHYQKWAQTIAPTVAIGGIKLHNLQSILKTGVQSVAVVTAITQAENPEAAVQEFMEQIDAHFH